MCSWIIEFCYKYITVIWYTCVECMLMIGDGDYHGEDGEDNDDVMQA